MIQLYQSLQQENGLKKIIYQTVNILSTRIFTIIQEGSKFPC